MRTLLILFLLHVGLLFSSLSLSGQCPSNASFSEYSYSSNVHQIFFSNTSVLDSPSVNQVIYFWDFGDGSNGQMTSDTTTVSHTYNKDGNYEVSLVMNDSMNFCSDTATKWIYISSCKPTYDFEINYDTGKFHYTGMDTNKSYTWYFSDFSTYFGKSITKIFNSPGQYYFILEVMDTVDLCYDTVSKYFTVPAFCKADFTYSLNNDSIQFQNNSTNYNSVSWDFGDGNFSTQANPLHVYDSSAIYNVCLTVQDSVYQCSNIFCDSIEIKVPDPCSSSFTYKQKLDSLWLFNNSLNYTNVEWDFGDGNTSKDQNPVHVYDSSGSYIVCLSVMDTLRNCLDVSCDTINILLPPNCMPSFTYTVNDSQVVFTNTSNNLNPKRFTWFFGDGTTSNDIHPSHVYNETDKYKVSLFMLDSINGFGCRSTYTDSIDVEVLCKAHYNIAIDSSQKFKIYLINNSSDYSTHHYSWNFGDGDSSTGRTTKHEYSSFGKYEVCLKITDTDLNCISTFCDSLGLDSNSVLLRGSFILEVLDQSAIGIDENEELSKISVFPNPSKSYLNIDLMHMNQRTNLSLFDISGKVLIRTEGEINSIVQLDLEQLPSGMYFLKIEDHNNNWIIKKIIR